MVRIVSAKLIAVSNATAYQLVQVHDVVKANADGWWHHMPHVWIVGGNREAIWWRDQIQPILYPPPLLPYFPGQLALRPSVLVLALPDSWRGWGYFGPNDQNEIGWLESEYQR